MAGPGISASGPDNLSAESDNPLVITSLGLKSFRVAIVHFSRPNAGFNRFVLCLCPGLYSLCAVIVAHRRISRATIYQQHQKTPKMQKIFFTLLLLLTSPLSGFSHTATPVPVEQPVKWSYSARKTAAGEAVILITATLADGWHLYALNNPANSPVRLAFSFLPDPSYSPEGKINQPEPVTRFEKLFGADISYFEHEAVFQQKVKLTGKSAIIKGSIEFTVCSPRQCLPPETISFNIHIK